MDESSIKKIKYVTVLILIAGNIFIWHNILLAGGSDNLELYFLDVGQGDSQLINLPGDVQVLIDGGRDTKVLVELAKIMPSADRYIDLIILTHPDYDHFGGLIDVLRTYSVGAVITNGKMGKADAYADFLEVIEENNIKKINLMAGDGIKYGDQRFYILSPNVRNLSGKDTNDTSLVLLLKSGDLKALYTGDISLDLEKNLSRKFDLSAQVLKVSHHGSKYASSPEFLKSVNPKVSVIEVGKNRYGHPTSQVLSRLANVGSKIFRTDEDGTIKISYDSDVLKIYK